jgi:PIN domain nuclease of toxin-antitoxin system
MTVVLDASALLAALLGEPGADRVDAVIDGASMSTVNLAEVCGHFARAGADRTQVEAVLAGLPIAYLAPSEEVAMDAGLMRRAANLFGLSLGDRMCLAQARRLGASALTADRAWALAAAALDVSVEMIR